MRNFCTLFDSNYLLQGLTLYRSLERHAPGSHLYIYAFDDASADILQKLDLSHATIIRFSELEDRKLKELKRERSKVEYLWTCTPFIIHHAITTFGLPACTYIDADMLFFADPRQLLEEMGDNSIQIVSHRYYQGQEKAALYGIYCVQFNTFRNNDWGMKALEWWRDACVAQCSATPTEGKFGDQKYLDDWPRRFSGVHELQHFGGGVAPWNFERYAYSRAGTKIIVTEKASGKQLPLVFYHYHNSKLFNLFNRIRVKSYYRVNLNEDLRNYVYKPYELGLTESLREIRTVEPTFRVRFASNLLYLKETLRENTPASIKRILRPLIRSNPS